MSKGWKKNPKSVQENQAKLTQWEEEIKKRISRNPLNKIDYVQILDAATLNPVTEKTEKIICGIAVYTGPVRLIDNVVLNIK